MLTYHYDSGGLVDAAAGVKGGVRTDYLKRLEQYQGQTTVLH